MRAFSVLDSNGALTILCRNLYLGADYLALFPPYEEKRPLGLIVNAFFRMVEKTRYPERAKLLAMEIATRTPHIVCLQEVFHYRLQEPFAQSPTIDLDFLDILLRELALLRENYQIATEALATEARLPIIRNGRIQSLQVIDRDVILVRNGMNFHSGGYAQFREIHTLDLPNRTHEEKRAISIRRAYGWIKVVWYGLTIQVFNTHLDDSSDAVQLSQARELCNLLMTEIGPVVIAGDMNAVPGSNTYKAFLDAGFSDPFQTDGKDTYGAKADLSDNPLVFAERIDHIFMRGPLECRAVEHFGDNPDARTAPPKLWPSDHAGLMAVLKPIPPSCYHPMA
ncbi:MAG: endonuclease/exonuclease/phosphatase family protein [Sulfuricella sp.]|nr:endonuclease/exonuclease/phosphatase family protein [Sulfuricella sp.]